MADDFLPPVVARLVADIAPYVAGLTEAQVRMDAFGTSALATMAKVDARMATMGAGSGGMGAGLRTEAAAANAAATDVVAANDRIALSAAKTAESADLAARQWQIDYERMAAATNKATADMEAANRQAVASTEAMATKMDAAAASSAATTAGKMELVKKAAAGISLVGVAAAAVTVKMAADFETATNKLVTSAGETDQSIGMVRQGLLTMAGEVGVSALQLAKDMYPVGSAGYHAAEGLAVLKAAEQGAKAEGAEGKKVADALSSALRDYYPHAKGAAEITKVSTDVMSKFIGATSAGKMTFDDLAGSLNSILPVSSAAKISLSDTLGVLASMTVHGISAQQATQNMADAIRHLQAPTSVMSKAMATLGLDSIDVAAKLGERGLSGTMQLLAERVKAAMPPGSDKVILQLGDALSKSTPKVQELGHKLLDGSISMAAFSKEAKALDPLSAKQAASFSTLAGSYHQLGTQQISGAEVMKTYGGMMQQVMGDATGLKVALMTTGENAQYTNDAIKTITGSTADAAGNVKGWSEVQNTFNQHLSQAKAALGALAVEVGTKLLPVISKMVGVVADVVGWLVKHKGAAEILAGVIGGALVVAFSALLAVFWGFAANPVTWIIAGIVVGLLALGAAVYMVIQHWAYFKQYLEPIARWVDQNVIKPIVATFKQLWQETKPALESVIHAIGDGWKKASDWTHEHWGQIQKVIDTVLKVIGPLVKMQIDGLVNTIKLAWRIIVDVFVTAARVIGDIINAIVGVLKGLVRQAEGIVEFFHGVFTGNWREAWQGIKDIIGGAVDAIGAIVGGIYNVGRDLVVGLWHGITALAGWIYDQARSFASNILHSIKGALGIASPSKETFEHGRFLVQGLVSGIEANTSVAVAAAQRMARAVLDGSKQGAFDLPGFLGTPSALSAPLSVLGGASLGVSGARSGPSVVHVHVNVEGSVHSVASLRAAVQDAVLQHKFRNATNGLG